MPDANFTITTILSRPQHFIVTPSIDLYNSLTKRISGFLKNRATQTESVEGEDSFNS